MQNQNKKLMQATKATAHEKNEGGALTKSLHEGITADLSGKGSTHEGPWTSNWVTGEID